MAYMSEVDEKSSNVESIGARVKFRTKIVWQNVVIYLLFHLLALYGLYLLFAAAKLQTVLFSIFYLTCGNVGITAGSHRLWSHRSYKAKWPLRALLCSFVSIAGQNDIYEWCRDHRVHHKYMETDADPHNINRGFFFAHMGWLLCRKHPEVIQKGKGIDLEDLQADPIVRFHRRHYYPMMIFFCFYLPTMIPVWCWGESAWTSFCVAAVTRYCLSLHFTWLVNSAAHYIGKRPFDISIEARENRVVAFLASGEGWHNYHHAFPWDYSTSELGYELNITKMFIDFMVMCGLAYDCKTASPKVIKLRKLRKGDGTRLDN